MSLIENGILRNLLPISERLIEFHGKKSIGRSGHISTSSNVKDAKRFIKWQRWVTANIILLS
jgi:hypothetical protein